MLKQDQSVMHRNWLNNALKVQKFPISILSPISCYLGAWCSKNQIAFYLLNILCCDFFRTMEIGAKILRTIPREQHQFVSHIEEAVELLPLSLIL